MYVGDCEYLLSFVATGPSNENANLIGKTFPLLNLDCCHFRYRCPIFIVGALASVNYILKLSGNRVGVATNHCRVLQLPVVKPALLISREPMRRVRERLTSWEPAKRSRTKRTKEEFSLACDKSLSAGLHVLGVNGANPSCNCIYFQRIWQPLFLRRSKLVFQYGSTHSRGGSLTNPCKRHVDS